MSAVVFLALPWRPRPSFPPFLFCRLQKVPHLLSSPLSASQFPCFTTSFLQFLIQIRRSCAAAMEFDAPDILVGSNFQNTHSPVTREGHQPAPEWKKFSSKELGIKTSMIAKPTRVVLKGLKKKGYDVYLVGGCVRDLVLKRTPKDFDILTSAELKDVLRTFGRCEIVGRRFPICHVHVGQTIIEVSSISTCGRKYKGDVSQAYGAPIHRNDKDYVRWRNCLHRDFTINGLMFDPFEKLVYDYMGGLVDIKKSKVRTIIPARSSFQEDTARMLRAIRIAARLDFHLARETAKSIKSLAALVLRLDKGRLLLEMNYMLAYGSAEASLRLLWKFGLLELLLPIQAAYFVHQGFRRCDERSNMLLTLFCKLDKLLAPDRPCNSCLWLIIFAFHKALVDNPRNPLVVAAFGIAVHNGGNMSEAVKIAQRISLPYDNSFEELLESEVLSPKALKEEVMDFAVSVESALSKMTDEHSVSSAMAAYPKAPYSDLVFIPLGLYLKTCRLFQCVKRGKETNFVPKKGSKIDYEMLAQGSLEEVRHVFARVVFDTVYPLDLSRRSH